MSIMTTTNNDYNDYIILVTITYYNNDPPRLIRACNEYNVIRQDRNAM